jgi:signal transduction histidine kinase
LIARYPQSLSTELPPSISYFVGDTIPHELQTLSPGFHDVLIRGRELHILVGTDRGDRFVLVDDLGDFEYVEVTIYIALGAGFIASLVLAVVLGLTTARRVIAPLTALAEAVQQDAPPDAFPSIHAGNEIGVLARAFAARTAELRGFLTRERLFTGDVSHELRTPLTIILGAAELLAARLQGRPELMAAAERIRRAGADAAERVSTLLLLSRVPEALNAPYIALTPLLEHEVERCRPLLLGKPVQFRLELSNEVWVFANPKLAAIAIGNLLRNACQYTEHGTVTARLMPGSLVIEDTGAGLPESVRGHLFERFMHGGDDQVAGSGLGLAIVKRVTEHLAWNIRLEAPPEGGSRFIVTFPAS